MLYGKALFKELPPTSRRFLLLAITDLKSIQFMAMTRDHGNDFTYELSDVEPNVLGVLCSILAHAEGAADMAADARGDCNIPLKVRSCTSV